PCRPGARRLRHPRGDPAALADRAAAGRGPWPARGHAFGTDGGRRRVAPLPPAGSRRMKKPGTGAGKAGGAKSGGAKSGGARALKTRIKKKSGLKNSSRRWLGRHLDDPYVHRSKAEGYRSRAAFKLIEIDDRHQLLKPGMRVIDLGAAPGGWCQVAAERVGSTEDRPLVVGIDYLEMDPVPGAVILQMDFLDHAAPDRLLEVLGEPPDVVLSD